MDELRIKSMNFALKMDEILSNKRFYGLIAIFTLLNEKIN